MFAKLTVSLFLATFAIPFVLSTPFSPGVNIRHAHARAAESQMTPERAYDILTTAGDEIASSCSELLKAMDAKNPTREQGETCFKGLGTALAPTLPVFEWLATHPKIPKTIARRHSPEKSSKGDSDDSNGGEYCARLHETWLAALYEPLCRILAPLTRILKMIPTWGFLRQLFMNLGPVGLLAHILSLPFVAILVPVKMMTDIILAPLDIFL